MTKNSISRKISKSRAFVGLQVQRWRNTYEPKGMFDNTVLNMKTLFLRAFERVKANELMKKSKK